MCYVLPMTYFVQKGVSLKHSILCHLKTYKKEGLHREGLRGEEGLGRIREFAIFFVLFMFSHA